MVNRKNLAHFFVLIFLVGFANQAFADSTYFSSDTNTIALWRFNEGQGDSLKDVSGNGHHGKFNKVPNWIAGQNGNAVQFDGNTWAVVPNAGAFNLTGSFDIEILFQMPLGTNTQKGRYLSVHHGFDATAGFIFASRDNTGFTFESYNSSGMTIVETNGGLWNKGVWNVVKASYNSATQEMRYFVNDTLKATLSRDLNSIAYGELPLTIGCELFKDDSLPGLLPFFGIMDEIKISRFSVAAVPNSPPAFTTVPGTGDTLIPEDIPYSFDLNATDTDGDPISFSLPIAPYSMSINSSSGLISWTPANPGRDQVRAVASDGKGGYDTLDFFINVYTNFPPQITTVLTGSDTMALPEIPYALDIDATDPNGDPITFSLPVKPYSMSIDAASGEIKWSPALSDTGSHAVQVVASDPLGLADTLNFLLLIAPPPPVDSFVFTTLTPTGDTIVTEGETLVFRAVAFKTDNIGPLSYRWTIDGSVKSTSTLCTLYTDFLSAGASTVEVSVSEGGDTLKNSWWITILNQTLPPEVLTPPEGANMGLDSLILCLITDPDIDTGSALFRYEFFDSDTATFPILTVDSIAENPVRLGALVQDEDLPENQIIYLDVIVFDTLGNFTDPSNSLRSFFFEGRTTGIENAMKNLPGKFALHPNQPNPFNPTTKIRFDIPAVHGGPMTETNGGNRLEIFDIKGKVIRSYFLAHLGPGYHSVTWGAQNNFGGAVPNGMYIYRIKIGNFTKSRKMLLVK